MDSDRLVHAFFAGAKKPMDLCGAEDVADRIQSAISEARSAWPDVPLDEIAFATHLGRHVYHPGSETQTESWDRLRPAELALAFQCGSGNPRALTHFEAVFSHIIAAVLRRFRGANVTEEDLKQLLRERLFVCSGNPKILEYSGQGFLENWLRVTALRTFTDAVRSGPKAESSFPDALLEVEDEADIELNFLKHHYRSEFKQAFEHAVNSLEGGARNLLRHSVVQRLSIDQIGALYGIHRATAARRLEKAKADLLALTRASLMGRLQVSGDEFDSIMGLIRSRFDISVARMLTQANLSMPHSGTSHG